MSIKESSFDEVNNFLNIMEKIGYEDSSKKHCICKVEELFYSVVDYSMHEENCYPTSLSERGVIKLKINDEVKKDESVNKIWLHTLKLCLEHEVGYYGGKPEVDKFVCIKNFDKIIKLSLEIMPNLIKMYFVVKNLDEAILKDATNGIENQIKKNFDGKIKLINVSEKEDIKNNVQVLVVSYKVDEIKNKCLMLYFADVKEDEESAIPKSVKHLIDEKTKDLTFKKDLKNLYSKKQ